MRADLRSRYRGAMVGVVVGDALGAAFEGHPGVVPWTRVWLHVSGIAPVTFTDDTAMTVAVAESLLSAGDLDEDDLANTFARHHARERGRGYSAGTAEVLAAIAEGGDWRELAARRGSSSGDGAAMRAAPFGLWSKDLAGAAELARRGARVTHADPCAVDAAGVQAAAVRAALEAPAREPFDVGGFLAAVRTEARTGELRQRLDAVADLVSEPAPVVAGHLGTGVAAMEAVPAAICAFVHHPGSFVDTVCFAIELGGDADTIASMAAAISGALLGDASVPRSWLDRVEAIELLGELGESIFERRTTEHAAP